MFNAIQNAKSAAFAVVTVAFMVAPASAGTVTYVQECLKLKTDVTSTIGINNIKHTAGAKTTYTEQLQGNVAEVCKENCGSSATGGYNFEKSWATETYNGTESQIGTVVQVDKAEGYRSTFSTSSDSNFGN
jgi:hypothetical protein